ncbi:WlaTC/HtrL family glycosyltransferase [Butyrivibrio sp. TB]|uniref:WlaTC/HtrL family glycosyltransferase n=1 Tax=Butyrivibrio sp. TB TaxID=1520809 RepID=UPI0008D4A13E|nr:WlaTC/HtrL family glycosyltransferase [Butyrivibrio sp. TB]SEP94835.1 protein of unknown function (HtrL_YibB) [Butyrivibrio sp. TB]
MNNYLTSDLNKSYKNITFVTMLFNLVDSKESKYHFSSKGEDRHLEKDYIGYYVKSLEKICDKFKDIIVFCDKECADNLKAPNARVIVMKLEELPLYSEIEQIRKLFKLTAERMKFSQNVHVNKKATEEQYWDRALYSIVVLSKQHILTRAAKLNGVDTEYLCWIDAGLLTDDHQKFWDGWNGKIEKVPQDGRVRFVCSSNKDLISTVKDIQRTRLEDAVYCRRPISFSIRYFLSLIGREIGPVPQILGGVEFIQKSACEDFEKKYNKYLKRIMSTGLICYEQGILTLMFSEHPEWFEVVLGNNREMDMIFNSNSTWTSKNASRDKV